MYVTASDTNNNTFSCITISGHNILIELLKNLAIVWWLHLSNCSQFNKIGWDLLSFNFPIIIFAINLPSTSVVSSIDTHMGPSPIEFLIDTRVSL